MLCGNSHYENIILRNLSLLYYTVDKGTEIQMFILGQYRLFPCPL
jgi:hypothetical protein